MGFSSFQIVKVLMLSAFSFVLAAAATPLLTHFLYKYKKNIRSDLSKTPIFSKLHAHKTGTPTMGGILIWGTVLLMVFLFFIIPQFFPGFIAPEFNFLSRKETLLPLGVLLASALVGLVDDVFNVKKMGATGGGLRLWHRLLIFTAIALIAAWWFFFKLEWTIVRIPFYTVMDIGWWTIPLFIFIIVATAFSVNETDGLDGLAGGVLLAAFATYAAISFTQGKEDLATFCGVICGALLAFLWFNIHPARFFMGDTGSMALGITLGVVAILTNTIWLLPFIGFILVIESGSVIIQTISKISRSGKKVFHSTPIHHHFEALGWGEPKIVMRFWIISAVMAVLGLVLFLIDKNLV